MDRDKPEVGDPGLQHWINGRARFEPTQECRRLCFEAIGSRRLEVNLLAADGAGHHLHWAGFLATPGADGDALHAAPPGGKERCVPVEEAACS
jgi:hypothetical protein